MRILFIGEYSRLHTTLKEGLAKLGHEAVIVGNGDGFKGFDMDYNIDATFMKKGLPNLLRQVFFRIFKYDLARLEHGMRFYQLLPRLKGFDIVQLVSDTPILAPLWMESALLEKLSCQNGRMFLLSSGTDTPFMEAVTAGKYRYSLYDAYLQDASRIEEYRHVVRHLKRRYKRHYARILELVHGVIATDLDYHIALEGREKYLGMIPNPVNVDAIPFTEPDLSGKIVIFHGINRWNYHKKGNAYFERALEMVRSKYGDKIEIVQTDTLPYIEYVNMMSRAHIVLDQVNAYDQGYNALEAMARGKVVFTGAESEFQKYYDLAETVAVNALPDPGSIARALSELIEEPSKVAAIGHRARRFVEDRHDYVKSAKKYLAIWNR